MSKPFFYVNSIILSDKSMVFDVCVETSVCASSHCIHHATSQDEAERLVESLNAAVASGFYVSIQPRIVKQEY